MAQTSVSTILKLAEHVDISSPTLIPDLRTRIPFFPIDNIQNKQRTAFETKGTDIWNIATRHSRDIDDGNEHGLEEFTKIALLRVYAFGMLESAAASKTKKTKKAETCTRMLKIAFKCIKACVDAQELDFAGKVASRAAEWLDIGEEVLSEEVRKKLGGEYFVWRVALAWKQDKLDVAEHMYEKFRGLLQEQAECAEELADVLYELSKDLFEKRQFGPAATWLGRALDMLDGHELDRLSEHAGDLRLAVLQKLVKALLMVKSDEAIAQARHLVEAVEHSYSDKLVTTMLKLEVLSMEKEPQPVEYYDAVIRMIRTIMLTRSNFKTTMHHIHKLKKLDATLATKALDELISLRLSRDAKEEWIERACMLRIWITAEREQQGLRLDELESVLDGMLEMIVNPFTPAAAHAAHTLLWSHIEKTFSEKQYAIAEKYCSLALHTLFERCGELNKAKICRKAMSCALAQADGTTARELYFTIPESQRNSAETRQLAFKAALRMNDPAWAAESLEAVAKHAGKDPTRLYACVLDAMQANDDKQAYQALSKVLDAYGHKMTSGVHLPALLRCMVRLIRKNLPTPEDDLSQFNESISNLASLLEITVEHTKKTTTSNKDFSADELSWFSKNSYNMAVECLDKVHPKLLHRLCLISSALIERLDRDTPALEKTNLKLRHIFSEYLAMTAMLVLARHEDNIELAHDQYDIVTNHGQKLRELIRQQMEVKSLNENIRTDLIAKHIQTIKFGLEAALRRGTWEVLPELFDLCWMYDDPKRWRTLADLAFSIHEELCNAGGETLQTYQQTVLVFIERVVNKSWKPGEPVEKLAKHLRCFFHLTLTQDNGLAAKCMNQVIGVAEQCRMSETPYPRTELEWMACTSFNHAVACFCVKDDANCQFWAEKAMTVAAIADDGGALANQLRRNYASLRFGEQQ